MRVEVGKALQWLRKSRSITQYQLASLAQIDYRHYQNIESGRVEIKLETLSRICSSLSCDLMTFFQIVEQQPWLQNKARLRQLGNELYVFLLTQEQAKFTLYPQVREIVLKWGSSLAQLQRSELDLAPFICLELNSQLQLVWRNVRAREAAWISHASSLEQALSFTEEKAGEVNKSLSSQIKDQSLRTCYFEALITMNDSQGVGLFAFFGLKPLVHSENQNTCLVFMEVEEELKSYLDAFELVPGLKAILAYSHSLKGDIN